MINKTHILLLKDFLIFSRLNGKCSNNLNFVGIKNFNCLLDDKVGCHPDPDSSRIVECIVVALGITWTVYSTLRMVNELN